MPLMIQQPGVFVQPMASGTVQGPIEQSGIEGATITFPELSVRMPSIRLPGRSRTRQNARMLLDQQYAPYVESPPVAAMPAQMAPAAAPVAAAPSQAMMAAAPQMQMMMAPAAAPQMQMMMAPAAAPQMMMMPQQMMQPQMMLAPQQYYIPQQTVPQQNPVQQMNPPQPDPDITPQRNPSPSCDARGYPTAATSAEEKIRQLEMAEQQLMQRMEALRRQLEQAEVSRRPPTPSPDLGARSIHLPAVQPLRATGIQPVQPISQQPQRPIIQPLPPAVSIYNERPAAYTSEAQAMPQFQQSQQYALPQYSQPQPVYSQQHVIREPQASITGFRSR
jgi:hypothetical protein